MQDADAFAALYDREAQAVLVFIAQIVRRAPHGHTTISRYASADVTSITLRTPRRADRHAADPGVARLA
jgi:hypothetical protein